MLGVGAIALFLSTVTDSSLGAALGALAALVTSQVLVTLNAAGAVSPYLPTRYWLAWVDFFREPILWRNIDRGFAVQGVYVVVLLGRGLGQLRHQGHHELNASRPGCWMYQRATHRVAQRFIRVTSPGRFARQAWRTGQVAYFSFSYRNYR